MLIEKLETMAEAHTHSAHYWGDHGDWGIAYFKHRGSDLLAESNFDQMQEALEEVERKDFEDEHGIAGDVEVEESSCSLVGRRYYLIVRPGSPAEALAFELLKKLEDYPVLDEDDFSRRESEACDERWDDMGSQERFDMSLEVLDDDEWESQVPMEGRIPAEGDDWADGEEEQFDKWWSEVHYSSIDPRGLWQEWLRPN